MPLGGLWLSSVALALELLAAVLSAVGGKDKVKESEESGDDTGFDEFD